MATELLVTIGSDVSRDYSTPQAAETAEQKDLISSDEYFVGEMYNDSDFGNIGTAVTGWTTGITQFITFQPAGGEQHDGTEGTGVIITRTSDSRFWRVYEQYTVIRGIEHTGDGWTQTENGGNNCLFDEMLVYDCLTNWEGFRIFGSSDDTVVRNCIIYGITTGGTRGHGIATASGANIFAEQCTVYNCAGDGMNNSGGTDTIQADNCVSIGNAGSDFAITGGGDYNCDGDATAPGANSIHSVTDTDQWIDPTGSPADFNVKDAGADIYHAAVRLSGVTVDIVDFARPDPTSIGAFEFQGAPPAGTILPQMIQHGLYTGAVA